MKHTGAENRHMKIRALLEPSRTRQIFLRTCPNASELFNCSECIKDLRAIAMIAAEGQDPNNWGYRVDEKTLEEGFELIARQHDWTSRRRFHWMAWIRDLPPSVTLNLYGVNDFARKMRAYSALRG